MLTGKKIRERIADFFLDHREFESIVTGFIASVDDRAITGPEKKELVLKQIQKWLDDKIALKGFWEMLSDIAIRFALLFVSGWVESIFERWKEKKNAIAPIVSSPGVEADVDGPPVRGRKKTSIDSK